MVVSGTLVFGSCAALLAAPLNLVVWAGSDGPSTRERLEPLAAYLSNATGEEVALELAPSALAHWTAMQRRPDYHLVMDGAHFTDYRVTRLGYHVLVKAAGVLTFSIVTAPGTLVVDLEDLMGQPVATLPSPNLSALRLLALFPDPIRTPDLLEVASTESAVAKVLAGEALAAVVPTAVVDDHPELNVVVVMEQTPRVAISAAPSIDAATRERIRQALLDSGRNPSGREMLANTQLGRFEPATERAYHGYARLLAGVWGF